MIVGYSPCWSTRRKRVLGDGNDNESSTVEDGPSTERPREETGPPSEEGVKPWSGTSSRHCSLSTILQYKFKIRIDSLRNFLKQGTPGTNVVGPDRDEDSHDLIN